MKNTDYQYLCNVIGNLTGVPIRIYREGELVYYHSVVDLPADPLTAFTGEILSITSHIGYFITPHFHYYGVVNGDGRKIVIGPSIHTRNIDQALKELAFRCDVSADETNDFIAGMKNIIPMPLDSILQILCTMNYIMNGEKLGLSDIRIYDSEQQELKEQLESQRANADYDTLPERYYEQFNVHNTLALEQTIMNFVRRGDTAALKEWISDIPAVRAGVLASDQLRQSKNTFIVTATLVSRAAIRGGMDVSDALSLSDAYIQKCELLGDLERITNLQYHMLFDYTEQVEKLRLGKTPSKLVLDVTNYIHHHLSEPVSTEEIAKALRIPLTAIVPEEDKIFLENVADRVRAFKLLANFYTGKPQEEGERKYTGLWGALMRGLKNR